MSYHTQQKLLTEYPPPHHERRLSSADVIGVIEKMVYHQDEPLGDSVCVPLYYVAKLANDAGVKVCQVGEGADKIFAAIHFG